MRLAVFISGGGTNLQALLDGERDGKFQSKIVLAVSDRKDAYGLVRAEKRGVPVFVSRDQREIVKALEAREVEGICLAGYLSILGPELLTRYKGRILNIHPSLLPKYGGMGMYGIHVHEAVFAQGEKESGATVHLVTEVVDGGEIILQKKIDISDCDSPEEIQKKVLTVEHEIYPEAVKRWEENHETRLN